MAGSTPPQPGMDWLNTYKQSSGSPNLKQNFTSFADGQWTSDKTNYWELDANTGQQLGITPVSGKYYISPNDFAWILQAYTDPKAANSIPATARSGVQSLLQNMLQLADYKDVSSYQNAANNKDMASASNYLIKAVNGVMVGNAKIWKTAAPMNGQIVNLNNQLKYQVPSSGPQTVSWTRNQVSQIGGFMGSWLGYQDPVVSNEISRAINNGMNAYQVEQQLFSKNPDPILANAAKRFQKAFPALAQARQAGKDIGIESPADYMRTKASYIAALRPYGLQNYVTSKQLDQMMTNTVSPQDLGKWAATTYETVQNADPQLKAILKQQFGLTNQDLQAYLLMPENVGSEVIADKMRASQLYSQGKDSGVTMSDAYKLTGMIDLGQISQQQAQQAIDETAAMRGLGQEAFGFQQGTQTTATAQDVMSSIIPEFAGNATAAAESALRVKRAQEERAQAGEAGGQMLTDQSGVRGAGQAQ